MALYELFFGPRDANRNIRAAYIGAIFQSIGFGMLWMNILSIFIFILADESTTMLGLVSAVAGIVSTIFLFPSGLIADRWRRDVLVWIGSGFAIIALAILVISVNIGMVIVAELFIGAALGISGTAREALLADSIPTGKRSKVYADLFFLNMIFSAVGPALNIVLFFYLGDKWDISILRAVIFVSAIFISIASCSTFFMADKNALGKESESLASTAIEEDTEERSSFTIPIIIVISGLIIGFGAGMTVYFFPIFFKEEYSVSPILLNAIFMFMNITTGFSGIAGQRISKRLGLVETMFLLQMSAVYALAFITQFPPLFLLIPLFIARNAFMNAAGPLNRTIVMDRIAKRHRAKWNSLEQLSWGFFWNVSAALGGWIIENFGFRVCFTITATLYMTATLLLLVLFGRVEQEGKATAASKPVTGELAIPTEIAPPVPAEIDSVDHK
ncbi:MAG: MFS transporter [Candidatus Hodarchaeales archaeon]|jgi:MFS family permease